MKNDVEKERKMVAIESEVARLKTSITKFTEKSLQNQDEEIKNDGKIQEMV